MIAFVVHLKPGQQVPRERVHLTHRAKSRRRRHELRVVFCKFTHDCFFVLFLIDDICLLKVKEHAQKDGHTSPKAKPAVADD